MRFVTARRLAEHYLPSRWQHVHAVAAEATRLAGAGGLNQTILVSAAWLHDIGYPPRLVDTGFHPLDAAIARTRGGVRPAGTPWREADGEPQYGRHRPVQRR